MVHYFHNRRCLSFQRFKTSTEKFCRRWRLNDCWFYWQLFKTQDPLEAFKWGVACGSATAFSDDLASEDFIQELIHEVTIEKFQNKSTKGGK